jgi:hypothetical protein
MSSALSAHSRGRPASPADHAGQVAVAVAAAVSAQILQWAKQWLQL